MPCWEACGQLLHQHAISEEVQQISPPCPPPVALPTGVAPHQLG